MAQYLQINDTLISYSLGDNLTSPSKVLFLVSDTQFSDSESWFTIEYAYNYDQPIGDTQTIQLPFVAEIENKFYYSLPWRTIKFIDSTTPGEGAETPTPSPSPTTTITPTFFEEEPLGEYIYDSMEAVSITGGGSESSSVTGYNNRTLGAVQGVNGVNGLSVDNNVVTLTIPGRYYIKARSGSYVSEWTSTAIYFISGDYETERFESQRRWCHAGTNSSDIVVTESSVVVDITQTTTFKIETYITKAKSGNGLSYGGGASLFVQKLANADGGGSSSGGSSASTFTALTDTPTELTADKYLKVNTEGTALELVDAPVGSGGGSSGGIGSNQLVTNKSNFYTSLPDVLLITHSTGSLGSFFLNWIENDYVYYQLGLIESGNPIPAIITFDNNNQGTFEEMHNATTDNFPNAENSISEHLAAGRGIYYGGSSSGGSNIVTGNYTGDDADTQTIELGFRPAMVHVKCTSAPYYGEMTQIDGLDGTSLRSYHTANHSSDGLEIEITNTGFQAKTQVTGNNSTFNHNTSKYYYYAISGSSSTSAFEVSTNPNPIEIEAPSTTSDAENFMDNLTFKNPPNNITINDVVFHFISHSSEYIKYQGLSKYNDTYTIFFNDDTNGTLKMTSDDDTSIFVGVLSLISYKYE